MSKDTQEGWYQGAVETNNVQNYPGTFSYSCFKPYESIAYLKNYTSPIPMAQLVKNPPAMQETWVRSLDWEDPLKKGKAIHSSILAWRIPWIQWGCKESDMTE